MIISQRWQLINTIAHDQHGGKAAKSCLLFMSAYTFNTLKNK